MKAARSKSAQLNESLTSFKLLDALRKCSENSSAEDVQELVALLDAFPTPLSTSGPSNSTPLHLTVRTARASMIPLDHRPLDLNAQDQQGSTPLHIAASLGRADIVSILLAQPDIDDCIKDAKGKTPLERASTPDTARMIQVARAQFNATYLEMLASYVQTGNSDALLTWLNKNRSRCIDYRARVPPGTDRGTTIVHEAARRRDLALLQLCYDKGADLLARDGRGKTAMDVTRDEKVRAWLKQKMASEGKALRASTSASASSGSHAAPVQEAPTLPVRRGYLQKWTNLAKGYKQRWFVLANGSLSYYRQQSEEGKASRGIIAMNCAKVIGPSEDKLKFEIVSTIAKFKFFLKADHPLEAMRWVEDLKMHIDAASTMVDPTAGPALSHRSSSIGDQSSSLSTSYSTSILTNPVNPMDAALPKSQSRGTLFKKALLPGSSVTTPASEYPPSLTAQPDHSAPATDQSETQSIAPSVAGSLEPDQGSVITIGYEGDDSVKPPHEENFQLLANSAKAQLEATEQLLNSLVLTPLSSTSNLDLPNMTDATSHSTSIRSNASSTRQSEIKDALEQSLRRLSTLLDEHLDQVNDREKWFYRRFERELEARRIWEDNMQQVAAQQEELEHELQRTAEKGSRRKRELKEYRLNLLNQPAAGSSATTDFKTPPGSPSPKGVVQPTQTNVVSSQLSKTAVEQAPDSDSESSDEEFYEAIDTGALPVTVEQPIATPVRPLPDKYKPPQFDKFISCYEPYRHLRTSLPISVDDRPSVSLWGILKNSIGKDLTKISFPVSFNEPTSMLERMAEDMEFSECLDAAHANPDSTVRIAYVAAFAMSNYSSTIGRIAKPFNPMLGETFEYCSLDKNYRYVSEQVSHHPPISTCYCQSPIWKYFGEVDAKNKFLGKSFEIRPTGMAHAQLRFSAEDFPNYPVDVDGKAIEHYSWKKVTTSVSNFIMGSPTIDHYGVMTVTNHQTGDKCSLTFKPRGWRAANACELKGTVTDAQGKVVWELAGRWSTQLVARRAGSGQGELKPDESVPAELPEYLLLWKNSPKPPRMPFNLTPYAITLNDKAEGLVPWLPPTDCRLRPDLHAFESGHFEEANNLKTGLEEVQRKTRRLRESGQLPPHRPRWFTRSIDPDTREGVWLPVRTESNDLEYWEERRRVGSAKLEGQNVEWRDVDKIFGDYALL